MVIRKVQANGGTLSLPEAGAKAVARSDSDFGAYVRAMRARLWPQQATVATAHKIARVVYHLLKHRGGSPQSRPQDTSASGASGN